MTDNDIDICIKYMRHPSKPDILLIKPASPTEKKVITQN